VSTLKAIPFVLMLLSTGAVGQEPAALPPSHQCEIGPVSREFGGTDWVVLSCDDHASMVVISDKGNPASPFVFYLLPQDGSYRVSGEGNGDKNASDAAGAELSKLSLSDLKALLAATEAAAHQQ